MLKAILTSEIKCYVNTNMVRKGERYGRKRK